MPRGIKSENVESGVSTEAKSMKKYTIGTGVKAEDVISYDREGAVLLFEVKGDFLPLSEDIVSQLGRDNRTRYNIAKEFHENWRGEDHEKLVESFSVDKNLSGSASDKLHIQDTKEWHYHWPREDTIAKYLALGYQIVPGDEANTFLGATGNKHEIAVLGKRQHVLMRIPMSIYQKRVQEKTKKNKEMAGLLQKQTAKELQGQGGFVAPEKDNKSWTEITDKEE